jgi:hypothetical protein
MAKGLIAEAKEYGRQVHNGRAVLPQFAMRVARAAYDGEIDETDAADVYEAYVKEAWGVDKIDLTETGPKVQVSKLRQIIKLCASKIGDPVRLLEDVLEIHAEAAGTHKTKTAYASMVEVARAQLANPRPLNQRQILNLIKLK